MRRTLLTLLLASLAWLPALPANATCPNDGPWGYTWFYNFDVAQLCVEQTYLTDFDVKFEGDLTVQILTGGTTLSTNPFPQPRRTQSYDAVRNETLVRWYGDGAGLSPNCGFRRHFGIGGDIGCNTPRVLVQYWTPIGQNSGGVCPGVGSSVNYPGALGTAGAELMNDTQDEVTVDEWGFRLEDRYTLVGESLNATDMPASSFTLLPGTPAVLVPGATLGPFSIPGVDPLLHSVVLYVRVRFSGASLGNAYGATPVLEWMASNVARSSAVPAQRSTWGRLKSLYR